VRTDCIKLTVLISCIQLININYQQYTKVRVLTHAHGNRRLKAEKQAALLIS